MNKDHISAQDMEAAREFLQPMIEALSDKLTTVLSGQTVPVVLQCFCDVVISMAGQDPDDEREFIAKKLQVLAALVRHMPAGPMTFEQCQAYLDAPETKALQERIVNA